MKKIVFLICLVLLISAGALLFSQSQSILPKNQSNEKTNDSDKITLIATFYPLAHFAERIGQDKVTVINLTPNGVEPHDFEPTPKDLVALYNADLFVYNGAGLEPWLDDLISDITQQTTVINTSVNVTALPGTNEESESNNKNTLDPHIWLNPVLAGYQVTAIQNGLAKLDQQNAQFYQQNAQKYIAELTQLDSEFKLGLKNCKNRTIVTAHDAFRYLAQAYNLQIISISGISPDEEPSAQKLAEISDFVRANNIKFIFFETLLSPKLSETIAQETGAQTAVLNPLEGLTQEEIETGESYLTIQRANLNALKIALECK